MESGQPLWKTEHNSNTHAFGGCNVLVEVIRTLPAHLKICILFTPHHPLLTPKLIVLSKTVQPTHKKKKKLLGNPGSICQLDYLMSAFMDIFPLKLMFSAVFSQVPC